MSTSSVGRATAVVVALAAATSAAAGPGNGIRLGGSEGRLHPFLELEGRYDSNVYYTADRQQVGDLILHVRPGFDLAVPGELYAVQLGGSLDWAQYLGVESSETRSQLSKLYGQAALGLAFNRRGVVGFELDDEFRRAQGTTALVLSNAVISTTNALRARVPIRPGGGAFVFTVNGAWSLESYESYFSAPICATCSGTVGNLGYNEFRAGGEAQWRFLPRTAAVLQGGWFSRVPDDSAVSSVSGMEVQTGLTGPVTPHLAGTVKVGYTSTSGLTDGNVSTWLATAEGEWTPTDTSSVRLGWTHGLGIDPGPSLYTSHRVYGAGRLLLAGRYGLRLDGNFEQRDYDRFAGGTVPGTASAGVLRIEPGVETGITRWLSASLGYAYSKRTSSLPAGTPALPGFEYSKSEVWLRFVGRY